MTYWVEYLAAFVSENNMKRRKFIGYLMTAPALMPVLATAREQSFADYKKAQNQGFADYQAELEQAFKQYRQLQEQEFANYRQQVYQHWGDQQIGSAKVLVRYSADLKSREIIDFENSVITIEVIDARDSATAKNKLRDKLIQIATATDADMQNKDVIEQRISKQMPAGHYVAASSDKNYIVADLLTGQPSPDAAQIQQAVVESANRATGATRSAADDAMQIYSLSVPLQAASTNAKSATYKPLVLKYSQQENLDPALVMAIMHSESAFNPLARSHIPAYGLMQIVPASAGRDASAKVYGKPRLLSASYLYNSENNIKIGTAYLNILFYRYLKNINNQESRIYCTIAAYNTGAGNVARAFGSGTNIGLAARKINAMPPAQVYDHLVANLPYAETRNYLPIVVSRYQSYKNS